ncbi:MAG: helix-turn-helix transcriptional regulator [Myxococcales bacterium]|nr:helix-turn-helix transcriptional regulator [Myxococcales bacterium]
MQSRDTLLHALVQRDPKPVVIFNTSLQVVAINPPMAALIGRNCQELEGFSLFCSTSPWRPTAATFEAVPHDATVSSPALLCSAEDTARVDIVATRMGDNIVVAVDQVHTRRGVPVEQSTELEYEVTHDDDDFGTLLSVVVDGAARGDLVGQRCHYVLAGRKQPCEGCPIASGPLARYDSNNQRYRISEVVERKAHRSRVRSRLVGDDEASALLDQRFDATVSKAGLTPREREILATLVRGLSMPEIAAELGISQRTVKYHKSNLLAKLGCESRLDLLRVFV